LNIAVCVNLTNPLSYFFQASRDVTIKLQLIHLTHLISKVVPPSEHTLSSSLSSGLQRVHMQCPEFTFVP